MGDIRWGTFPQNPLKVSVNRLAKTLESKNRSNSETINPIMLKYEHQPHTSVTRHGWSTTAPKHG